MNEAELHREFNAIADAYEAEQEVYCGVSLEPQRTALIEDFHTQFAAIQMDTEPDKVFARVSEEDLIRICVQLEAHIEESEVRKYEALCAGLVEFSGPSMHVVKNEHTGETTIQMLNHGQTIRGDIDSYVVFPMLPAETIVAIQNGVADRDAAKRAQKVPGLWMVLENATMRNEEGVETEAYERTLVLMDFPEVTLEAIRYQEEMTSSDITEVLTGRTFLAACTDAENDINFNNYTEEEQFIVRKNYQERLCGYTAGIDMLRPFVISTVARGEQDGQIARLNRVNVFYNGPSIVRINKSWRVVHGFEAVGDTVGIRPQYTVCPEDITFIGFGEA